MKYSYCKKDFNLAKRYFDAVLSMNGIFKTLPDNGDKDLRHEGLVPVVLSPVNYDELGTWEECKKLLLSVYEDYKTIDNDIRANYMFEQISSVITLGEWVFENKKGSYRKLVSDLMFIDPNPATEWQLECDRQKLHDLLGDKKYRGSLKERLQAWKDDNLVPKAELEQTLDKLSGQCLERTLALGFEGIEDIKVKAVIVHDVPYSGYCDFPERAIYVNGDLDYFYPTAKRLMSHETHPGHTTHMQLRKLRADAGLIPVDALLVITNTASSPVFEGLADNGPSFTGWINTLDDEIALTLQNMNAKINNTCSHMLHELGKSRDETREYLKKAAFSNDASADTKLRMITNPLRMPFSYSYWRGNEAVAEIYSQLEKHRAFEFLRYAYNNMHSVNTIVQFTSSR
jgi:hypothetical protein